MCNILYIDMLIYNYIFYLYYTYILYVYTYIYVYKKREKYLYPRYICISTSLKINDLMTLCDTYIHAYITCVCAIICMTKCTYKQFQGVSLHGSVQFKGIETLGIDSSRVNRICGWIPASQQDDLEPGRDLCAQFPPCWEASAHSLEFLLKPSVWNVPLWVILAADAPGGSFVGWGKVTGRVC